jgi:hypothetical protein
MMTYTPVLSDILGRFMAQETDTLAGSKFR